ncbi:DUF4199 domain-containing protein [Algoriphagus boritolerans]|uniref:DUF4199 domain-containing protein n=1 Tax=Algoriphagus boritolerans DSM 17298 = JCM 18970 TaxID=1120964 RepID=A0A1H5VWX1_9BACT|nr:DUF4199 domain-containing protein [Algoriphagus boritolerans]SEF91476.1 Protein of unknown function [Algoriphagus boritolerans DSM 17298 = JCM 18970]
MNKYLSTAYKFGGLGGVLSVLSFYSLSFLNPDPTNLNLIFGYFLVPVSIYLSIKFYKEYSNSGFLSFAEGMTVGFVTYGIIGILSIVGIWLVLQFSPELFEVIRKQKLDLLIENRQLIIAQVGENSFFATEESMKNLTPWNVAVNDGLWKIIPGMFFSIIISIILRKNPN